MDGVHSVRESDERLVDSPRRGGRARGSGRHARKIARGSLSRNAAFPRSTARRPTISPTEVSPVQHANRFAVSRLRRSSRERVVSPQPVGAQKAGVAELFSCPTMPHIAIVGAVDLARSPPTRAGSLDLHARGTTHDGRLAGCDDVFERTRGRTPDGLQGSPCEHRQHCRGSARGGPRSVRMNHRARGATRVSCANCIRRM